jgi:hypothetical protein
MALLIIMADIEMLKQKYSIRNQDQPVFTYDIVVNNVEFLQLTLNILADNNVISILASQRIHMPDDENYGPRTRDMYNALDNIFGKKRKFLHQSIGEEIGRPLRNADTQNTKVPILAAIQQKYHDRNKSNIILLDDHADSYQASTEQAGYRFIHAPRDARDNNFNSYQDSAYLFQVLLQTVRVHDIYRSIARMPKTQATNTFKKGLLHYQLDNLVDVCYSQADLIKNERPGFSRQNMNAAELAAKDILAGIQNTIFDTKWDIGFFGGEKVVDSSTGLFNIVPKNMRVMLDEIEKAKHGNMSWLDVLTSVEQLGKTASAQQTHSFFNKRGDTTQLFYDTFQTKNFVTMALEKADSVELDRSNNQHANILPRVQR